MWERLAQALPSNTLAYFNVILPSWSEEDDKVYLVEAETGSFSVRSAYVVMNSRLQEVDDGMMWMRLWRWQGPERIKMFIWLVLHWKLLTNNHRKRLKMDTNDSYHRCGRRETILHALRECPHSMEAWNELLWPSAPPDFFELDTVLWA